MRTISDAIDQALALDDDEVYLNIGAITRQQVQDPGGQLVAGADGVVRAIVRAEAGVDLPAIGRIFFDKVNKQANELLCGSGDDYKEEREAIQDAVGEGAKKVAEALAAFLLATGVGIPAAALAFVASLLAKLIVEAGGDTLCKVWTVPD